VSQSDPLFRLSITRNRRRRSGAVSVGPGGATVVWVVGLMGRGRRQKIDTRPVRRGASKVMITTKHVRADGFVEPCSPTLAAKPPAGPDWVHEIKHDGYRLIVRRDGPAVRLFTRRGHDWTDRYPAIAAAAAKLRAKSFTLDGEAVVTGGDGIAVFDALHRRHKASDAMLYAFDLLELNGKDLRALPLNERKAKLARLLALLGTGVLTQQRRFCDRSGRRRRHRARQRARGDRPAERRVVAHRWHWLRWWRRRRSWRRSFPGRRRCGKSRECRSQRREFLR
jgi:ATP dependent DNA ligase domain